MTNIRSKSIWPHELEDHMDYPGIDCLAELFDFRKATYVGFAEIEKDKGLLQPTMSLSTTHGQEAVRILIQRGLEELAEAFDSTEEDHYLEELIDAVNYFWALAILDEDAPLFQIIEEMVSQLMGHAHYHHKERISFHDMGMFIYKLNGLCEKLRHRAWMNHAQSQYFDGWHTLANFLGWSICLIWDQFRDWPEFVRYFIAKDRVLQFRIQTKY